MKKLREILWAGGAFLIILSASLETVVRVRLTNETAQRKTCTKKRTSFLLRKKWSQLHQLRFEYCYSVSCFNSLNGSLEWKKKALYREKWP